MKEDKGYTFSYFVDGVERMPTEDEVRKYQDIMLRAFGYRRAENDKNKVACGA